MNILAVYPDIPCPTGRGTYQQVFHLLQAPAKDRTVDLIALSEEGGRMEHRCIFEGLCRKVIFVPSEHPPWPRLFPNRMLHAAALRQKIEARGMQTCRGRFGWPGLGRQPSSRYSPHFLPVNPSHAYN